MYDVAIIGGGVSGVFLAYTLVKENEDMKILIIEKGNKFIKRTCPIEEGTISKCTKCAICSKFYGFGGLGRSEGKFNYTNDFGGELHKKIGEERTLKFMKKVDEILCSFGGDRVDAYSTKNDDIDEKCELENIKILSSEVRHLGTKISYEVFEKMQRYLDERICIEFLSDIKSIRKIGDAFQICSKRIINSKKLVLATGGSGSREFEKYCEELSLEQGTCRVDLGIRVEMKESQLAWILERTKETKIEYKDENIEAYTYCMNPKGRVIKKHQEGLVLADGQNSREEKSVSTNLNFTVFVPRYFNNRDETESYARNIIENINKQRERVLVQRLEDLNDGIETTEEKLSKNLIKATLKCEAGNLLKEVPKIYIEGLLKILNSIEHITEEKIHGDTLLYGLDMKLYEPYVHTNKKFESHVKGLYIIGDCSGVTWSLSQAAASGIYVGETIGGLFND